jgi:sugar lactone lactonase YvrE
VIKVDPATGKETPISSNDLAVNASSKLFDYVQGLGLDHNGNIVVANASTHSGQAGNIVEVDPATGKESELSGNDMAVNASSQYLWAPVNLVVDATGNLLVAYEFFVRGLTSAGRAGQAATKSFTI